VVLPKPVIDFIISKFFLDSHKINKINLLMIKALIFDMDGVIIDSEPFWRQAEVKIFNAYQIPVTEDMCRQVTGLRIDEVVGIWLKKFNKEHLDSDKLQYEIVDEVAYLVNAKGVLLPGVIALMQETKKLGLKMAIASSSYKSLIKTVVDKFGLGEYIELWKSSESEEFGKPHPAVYLSTANALGVSPKECLVIEDSFNGIIAAIAARMQVVAVPDETNFKNLRFDIATQKIKSLVEFDLSWFNKLG
jgi:sugar-phosphatase